MQLQAAKDDLQQEKARCAAEAAAGEKMKLALATKEAVEEHLRQVWGVGGGWGGCVLVKPVS